MIAETEAPKDLLGYMPPHHVESERAVLGAVVVDNSALDEIVLELNPEDFYSPAHATIYQAMLAMHAARHPIDYLTLAHHLRHEKKLEDVGGAQYVSELATVLPTSVNGVYYAKVVKTFAMRRRAVEALSVSLREVHDSTDKPEEVLERIEQRLFAVTQKRLRVEPQGIDALMSAAYLRLTTRQGESKLKYGFPGLDLYTHGLHNGQLIVLAARPSMGKSTMAINVIRNLCSSREHEGRVLFFSLEMPKEDVIDNLVCSLAKVDTHRWRARNSFGLSRDDQEALHDAQGFASGFRGLAVDDESGITVTTLRAKARRHKATHGLDAIFVDYLQFIHGDRGSKAARHEVVGEISRGLKALARELEIPVVALAQLNRNVEDRQGNRPRLSDLRESGSIEADADVVLLLHRESYYESDPDKREASKNQATLIVAKNRNGPTGDVALTYQPEYAFFGEAVQ